MATLKERAGITTPPGFVVRADKRTRTSEHWQNLTDPTRFAFTALTGPVHYKADPFDEQEAWSDIDLSVVETPEENWDAAMENAGYQVRFWQARVVDGHTLRYCAQFRRAGCWLAMAPIGLYWMNAAGKKQLIKRPVAGITPTIDNDAGTVTWEGAFGSGLHWRYNLKPDRFLKTVIIRAKTDLPAPTIGTTGLRLVVVLALAWGGARPTVVAVGTDVDEFNGDVEPDATPDEEVTDPGQYAHLRDSDAQPAFWVRAPRAWDSNGSSIAMQCKLRRRAGRVFAQLGVLASALNAGGVAYPVYIDTDMSEEQVAASSDDGYDTGTTYPGTVVLNTDGVGLRIGSSTTSYYAMAARFTPPIPQGVTVDTAVMSVCGYSASASEVVSTWYGEDVDNSGTLTTDHSPGMEIYANRTTASVAWALAAVVSGTWYNVGTAGSVATIVQEIVDRASWVSGNGMTFLGVQTSTDKLNANHWFRSYDYTGNANGAKLNVSYTETAVYKDAAVSASALAGGSSSGSVLCHLALLASIVVGGSSSGTVPSAWVGTYPMTLRIDLRPETLALDIRPTPLSVDVGPRTITLT